MQFNYIFVYKLIVFKNFKIQRLPEVKLMLSTTRQTNTKVSLKIFLNIQ